MPSGQNPLAVEIVKALEGIDPPHVYRAARCPLLIVSGERYGLEELMPAEVLEAFAAYRRAVGSRLKAVAAQNAHAELVTLPTTREVHREAPDAVARLVVERLGRDGHARL